MNETLAEFARTISSVTDADALIDALQTERLTSIRTNPLKLQSLNLPQVPWCGNGYYLESRPVFTLDPLFHAGAYYVQEASSMFLEQIVKPFANRPLRALDVCAAPGGKSTLVLSLLPEGSLLVANEVIRSRSQILAENIAKWGMPNCIVTNNDPDDFSPLKGCFDLILVDAPCSGEGMFRKDSNAIHEWSPEHVELCSKRQMRILSSIWDCLAPEGMLVYSTCTFNEKENEDVVARFIGEHDAVCERVPLQPEWNIVEREKNGAVSYRFFPHLAKGEGFSVSVMRKRDGKEFSPSRKPTQSKRFVQLSEKKAGMYASLMKKPFSYLADKQKRVYAFPKEHARLFFEIDSHCSVVQAGTPLAEAVGDKLNPLPELAFSTCYAGTGTPQAAVGIEDAVRYFRKESLALPSAPKGWVQLVYKDVSVGFVKNIGNRANNPYPSEWAIKMNVDYGRLGERPLK